MISKILKNYRDRERRTQVRLFIDDLLDGFIVREGVKPIQVYLNDISKGGLSFLIDKKNSLKVKDKVNLNLYFKNSDKFFQCEFVVKAVDLEAKDLFRHAIKVVPNSDNQLALEFLADFVASVTISKQNTRNHF